MAQTVAEDKSASLKTLVSQFAERTGMHGLPRIRDAPSLIRRAFWCLVVLFASGMFLWQVTEATRKYLRRPTSTDITHETENYLEFPAVTICNLNAVRMSAVRRYGLTELETLLNAESMSWYDFLSAYVQLDDDDRTHIGYNLTDMLLECFWNYDDICTASDFEQWTDMDYGNCYTFNGGQATDKSTATSTGISYGLSVTLYVGQQEYSPNLVEGAGYRVLVHNATYQPFPSDEGFSVAPGFHTYIGLSRVERTRTKLPYGYCEDVPRSEVELMNLWASRNPNIGYSSVACLKTCYQRAIAKECGCGDPALPLDGLALEDYYEAPATSLPPCVNYTQARCHVTIYKTIMAGDTDCDEKCPPLCFEVSHDSAPSYSAWPTIAEQEKVWNRLYQMGHDVDTANVSQEVLKVTIYFTTTTYKSIKTSPAFTVIDLLSSYGGAVGLWLACSVITLFELVELLVDISMLCNPCLPTHTNKNNPARVADTDSSTKTT